MSRPTIEHYCKLCGEKDINLFYVSNKSKCKPCYSIVYQTREDREEYIKKQKGWRIKNIIRYRVLSAKHRAIRNGLVFEINDDIIKEKIESQQGLCYISKQPFSYMENDWNSLSLDRLDSNLGYTQDNTIIVTKFVNNSKTNLSLDEYTNLIKLTYEGFFNL
jgi:hypothetical protein